MASLEEKALEARDPFRDEYSRSEKFFSWQLPGKVVKQLVISRAPTN